MKRLVPLLLFLALGGLAQSTLGVEPPVLLKEAKPGDTLTHTLLVHNVGTRPVRVRVSLGDWTYDPMGRIQFLPVGALKESASPWATFSPAEFTLEPKQSRPVTYTLTVPRDATPGSHWGILFLEAEDPNPPPGIPLATFRVRMAHVFYVNIPPLRTAGRITGIVPSAPKGPQDPFRFAIQYQNTGNTAQKLSGRFEVRDPSGRKVAEVAIEEEVVLPGQVRILPVSLVGPLPAGNYTALVVLNYGDPERDVAADLPFTLRAPLAAPPAPPTPPEGEKGGTP
ncbi:MAG: hypothetical protein NZ846_01040 [Thermus sp.]|uniref:hypothetical protein n=2 Tax=Thermus TaxID=270 RepID=UPI00023892FF|nr:MULTISPECIES: hypothetical protein [unclassified Thermus]AEV17192.1 hypothetical protein TCCBUS3UF1_21560 [Thermus sp. CCB_US3_UF1]MCS7217557.1 hypothetical protein [Thermus sp.]MCX7850531.1 hypothetical protein [Thermus sp.]MDW8018076.1 hypothetical protein [Thermus sp.]